MHNTNVLWITGPAGSGKDEVCRILKKQGFVIIDADKIGHNILQKKNKLVGKVFGAGIVQNGKVDRKALGRIVFSKKSSLKKLNSIIHPDLIKSIRSRISSAGNKDIAINAALYKELESACPDAPVISVLSSRGTRVKRLLLSRKTGLEDILLLISVQKKDSCYKKISDMVILNDSSLESLEKAVTSAVEALRLGA